MTKRSRRATRLTTNAFSSLLPRIAKDITTVTVRATTLPPRTGPAQTGPALSTHEDSHMAIETERILEDAEIAAMFLRALVDKGVNMNAAVSLTCSYMSSVMMGRRMDDKPDEPWKDPGGK
jgi:hypothetical protein